MGWLGIWVGAEKWMAAHYTTFSGVPKRQWREKSFLKGRASSSVAGHLLCVEEEVTGGETLYRCLDWRQGGLE